MLFLSTVATQIERKMLEKLLGAQSTDVFYSYLVNVHVLDLGETVCVTNVATNS